MKSWSLKLALICIGLSIVPNTGATGPVRPTVNPVNNSPAASQTLPQITSIQVLLFGEPVDNLVAGAGDKGYKLKITGQGFDSSSKAFLDGKKIPTNVISSTEIIARLRDVKLIPGELSLQVVDRDGGSSAAASIDVVSKPSVLSISSISPTVAKIGDSVTIAGIGFTPTGNRIRFVRAASPDTRGLTGDLNSADSSSFDVDVPDTVCAACPAGQPCPTVCFGLEPGEYLVAIENSNGLSNSLSFLVSSQSGPIGFWGGDGIATIVTDTQVQVEGLCFSGLMPQTLTTDAAGSFDMMGTYHVLAGPIRPGQQGVSAEFSGAITGNTMVMTIVVNSQFTLGPYTFTFGNYETIVHPCL